MWLESRLSDEAFWVHQYTALLRHGYRLRARWHPDWIPSWILPDGSERVKPFDEFDDAEIFAVSYLLITQPHTHRTTEKDHQGTGRHKAVRRRARCPSTH